MTATSDDNITTDASLPVSAKLRPVNYKYISRQTDTTGIYTLMDAIIAKHYTMLTNANIIIMKRLHVKPDADGLTIVAEIKKSSDMMKELLEHDLIMVINDEAWEGLDGDEQKCALDTELSRAVISQDKQKNYKQDDCGRFVWRLKKRFFQAPSSIAKRYNVDAASIVDRLEPQYEPGSILDQAVNS